MNTERVLTGLALIFTFTIGGALVRRATMTPPPAPVAAPRVELSPAERATLQAARKAEARGRICLAFERSKSIPAGVAITTATALQQQRYLVAIAADAERWQLDAPILTGLALMADPATDAREYWRAAAIVSGTCASGGAQ